MDAARARRSESARALPGKAEARFALLARITVVIVLPFFRLVHFPLPSPIHVPLIPQEHILSAENSNLAILCDYTRNSSIEESSPTKTTRLAEDTAQ